LDRRLGGPHSQYRHGGEEKNSQPLPGLEPPIIQPVVQRYTTELSRLIQGRVKQKTHFGGKASWQRSTRRPNTLASFSFTRSKVSPLILNSFMSVQNNYFAISTLAWITEHFL
jgi:hypothetical protein